MRRQISILALLLLAFALIFAPGCEGPEGPAGANGQDGQDGQDGTDGSLIPSINTIAANPPVITVGDTTEIMLSVSYSGDSTVYYNWSATHGTISGGGIDIDWIAPDVAGSYVITVSVTAGSHTSQGAVSVLVTASEETPVFTYSGLVSGEMGEDISPVLVYENSDNFIESSAGGFYELFSTNTPIALTFFKQDYQALTINGVSMPPNIKLRSSEPEIPQFYSVMIKTFNVMWYPDSIRWSVGCSNGTRSRSLRGGYEEFNYYHVLDSVPAGEWHFYAKAHDRDISFMGVTPLISVDHDILDSTDAIEIEVMAMKEMQVRTILDFPEMGIEKFIVEAYIDSSIEQERMDLPIESGNVVINWDHWHNRSVRDSIQLCGGFLFDNYYSTEIFDYNVQCRLWGREPGIYATRTIKDISWGTYWLSIDMQGAIPEVNATLNESDRSITFDIYGSGDVYCIELFYEYSDTLDPNALDYKTYWRGITENGSITLPALPPGYEIYPWEPIELFYQVSSFVDPDFSIDDIDIEDAIERELSQRNNLIIPADTTDTGSLMRRREFPGKRLVF